MLVVVSDTHRQEGHGLAGAVLDAAAGADLVVHAGDFTTTAVLEAYQSLAPRVVAVHGNADDPSVQRHLPTATTTDWDGLTVAVTHRPTGDETGLAMFGRERGAEVVVHGHTHRPRLVEAGAVHLLNPGSPTDPRGFRPGFATVESTDDGHRIALRDLEGTTIQEAFVGP